MNNISNDRIEKILLESGFSLWPQMPYTFLIDSVAEITPAFCCRIQRRRNKVRIGGSLGIFFREFENIWRDEFGDKEYVSDFTLPLIMAADNYIELIDAEIFQFSDKFSEIEKAALNIFTLCLEMPKSIGEFSDALTDGSILGKNVYDYLHIFDYNNDDNPFFRKSAAFIYWFSERWPRYAEHIRQCLTSQQRRRLG